MVQKYIFYCKKLALYSFFIYLCPQLDMKKYLILCINRAKAYQQKVVLIILNLEIMKKLLVMAAMVLSSVGAFAQRQLVQQLSSLRLV